MSAPGKWLIMKSENKCSSPYLFFPTSYVIMEHNDFLPHQFLLLCHNLLKRFRSYTSVVPFYRLLLVFELKHCLLQWLIWSSPMCWNMKMLYFSCWSSVLLPLDGTALFRRWKALLFGQDCIHSGLRFCVLLPVITEKLVLQPLSSKLTPHICTIHRSAQYILPLLYFNYCQKASRMILSSEEPFSTLYRWSEMVQWILLLVSRLVVQHKTIQLLDKCDLCACLLIQY